MFWGTRNFTVRTPLWLISESTRSALITQVTATKVVGPLFRQTDGLSTMSSIRQACLRTTPFSHAFRPRFPATPKPRLSATSFSHAFRPCLPTCHSDRGRCAFVPAMCQANEPLSDIQRFSKVGRPSHL